MPIWFKRNRIRIVLFPMKRNYSVPYIFGFGRIIWIRLTPRSWPPVMCQVMYVKALGTNKIAFVYLGAVWDSYSMDNFIAHKQAKNLELVGRREAILSVEGLISMFLRLRLGSTLSKS